MKLNANQIQRLSEKILNQWKKQNLIHLKSSEAEVLNKIVAIITADYQREAELDKEVNRMLDQLEKTHSGEFQRYKMYPILKQKLAKEKKVIL
ncbi:MAG: DUF507 family protein [Bdellovibrionia bacterium]